MNGRNQLFLFWSIITLLYNGVNVLWLNMELIRRVYTDKSCIS